MQDQDTHLVHRDPEPDSSNGASWNVKGQVHLAGNRSYGQQISIRGAAGVEDRTTVVGTSKGIGDQVPASRPYSGITGSCGNHRHFKAVGDMGKFKFVKLIGDLQIACGNGAGIVHIQDEPDLLAGDNVGAIRQHVSKKVSCLLYEGKVRHVKGNASRTCPVATPQGAVIDTTDTACRRVDGREGGRDPCRHEQQHDRPGAEIFQPAGQHTGPSLELDAWRLQFLSGTVSLKPVRLLVHFTDAQKQRPSIDGAALERLLEIL
jgi:hypothetical protein